MAKKMNLNNSNTSGMDIALWCLIIFLFLILICFAGFWGRNYYKQKQMMKAENFYGMENFQNVEHMNSYMEQDGGASNTDDEVDTTSRSDVPTLVMFKAEWCGHCQRMKPAFQKCMNMKRSNPNMKIIMVDADERKDLVSQHGIEGFPCVRLYPRGMRNRDNMIEYEGDRSEADLVRFLNDNSN